MSWFNEVWWSRVKVLDLWYLFVIEMASTKTSRCTRLCGYRLAEMFIKVEIVEFWLKLHRYGPTRGPKWCICMGTSYNIYVHASGVRTFIVYACTHYPCAYALFMFSQTRETRCSGTGAYHSSVCVFVLFLVQKLVRSDFLLVQPKVFLREKRVGSWALSVVLQSKID